MKNRSFKRLKSISVFCFISLLAQNVDAQSVTIKSRVFDKYGEPIPYAHIYHRDSNSGTISNTNGSFLIKIAADSSSQIEISSLGFATKKIKLSELLSSKFIRLDDTLVTLGSVTITPQDYAKETLTKAIHNISFNYPTKSETLRGFSREKLYWDKKDADPVYVAEATIEVHKQGYQKGLTKRHVKVLKGRKYASTQLDSVSIRFYGSLQSAFLSDHVQRRTHIFDLKKLKNFDFEITDTLNISGQMLFEISYNPLKKDLPSGKVFIQDSSFAIVKSIVYFDKSTSFDLVGEIRNLKRQFKNTETEYYCSKDQKWRLKFINYTTSFETTYGELLFLQSEYVTTQISNEAKEIPYINRAQHKDVFLDKTGTYDAQFWKDYTIILSNPKTENLFELGNSLDEESHGKSPNQKLLDFLARFRLSYALSITPIDIQPHSLEYSNNGLVVTKNELIKKIFPLALSSRFHYALTPSLFIGIVSDGSLSKNSILSTGLSSFKEFNLNPKGRPFILSPGIRFGYQQLNHSIGKFSSTEDFQIDGKSFDSGETNIFIQQRGLRLLPTLSLGFEKSNRLQFFSEIGYSIPLGNTLGVLFDETNEFFIKQKKSFLKNGKEGLSISPTTLFPSNFWTMTLGFHFGL